MSQYNPNHQQKLRVLLLQNIETDWQKHFIRHSVRFAELESIKSKNGFVADVADVVEKRIAEQIGVTQAKKIAPSKDFFRRLFFQYNPDTRWQEDTRQALCLYVGYNN